MKQDPEIRLLLFYLDQAFGRRGWHGPTLSASIRNLPLVEALWRPAPARHSVWELVLHAAFWKHAVRQRLTRGTERFPRLPRNWPRVPADPTASAWADDIALLKRSHDLLVETVRHFSARALHRKIPGTRYIPAEQILGIAAHDAYHTGQISLLRRLYQEHPAPSAL